MDIPPFIHSDPIFDTIHLTYDQQTNIRGKPLKYLLYTIDIFNKYTNATTIVEVGSIRGKMNHSITEFNPDCCNDGHSTYFWRHYTKADVYTVDINPSCKDIIEKDDRLTSVHAHTGDAHIFLQTFDKKIDLLFLDAWDVIPNTPYAEEHLKAYMIIKDKLAEKCLILIDDTDIGNGGKGKLLIPQLLEDGFTSIVSGRQSLFIRSAVPLKKVETNLCDILICLGPNDYTLLPKLVDNITRNVLSHRKIYVVTLQEIINFYRSHTLNVIFIDETVFPCNKEYIENLCRIQGRGGWYLQQLIKMYASIVITDLLDNYLMVDADVYFHKPVSFFENNRIQFNIGTEYHIPYFDHMIRLHPSLTKINPNSGIAHLMPMKRKIIQSFMKMIEEYHIQPFWKVFVEMIESTCYHGSGASEYEMLFTYTIQKFPDDYVIRPLKWQNSATIHDDYDGFYEACHYMSRK
jgi:hypothetical protein